MRKYHQAALAIIASISLVALLLYRNEYNKLRYVLEVLNYFGRPADMQLHRRNCSSVCSFDNGKCNLTASQYAADSFDDPIPSWQRLTDEIYVYSAHATGDGEVSAVGFAKSKRLSSLSCKVVYENEIEPVAGEFTYKTIESSESIDRRDGENASKGIYRGYRLICRYDRIEDKAIAGLIFVSQAERYKSSDEVTLSVRKSDSRNDEDNDTIGICVAPSTSRPIINTDMIDFISFHHSLGIERFVVYDFGIPQRINNILRHMERQSSAEFNLRYATVPWNFPFTQVPVDVVKLVIQADCIHRLYNRAGFVATLTWDEYVVMKYHRTVGKLFQDIDKTGLVGQRYRLSTSNFCLDRADGRDDNSKPMLLGDGRIVDNRPVYIYRSTKNISVFNDDTKTREITSDVIVVNRYERRCNRSGDFELKYLDDHHVGKFSAAIQTSPIYTLFRLYI